MSATKARWTRTADDGVLAGPAGSCQAGTRGVKGGHMVRKARSQEPFRLWSRLECHGDKEIRVDLTPT